LKTSIIICSYNEEKTISDVIISCCKYNPDAEIIVVDDGSVDRTETILTSLAKDYTFKYERFKKNKGKSYAMAHGVEVSSNEIILFFDADVTNIKKEHFINLLKPLTDDTADMVLGQPSETLIDFRINPFKSLTGERAVLKKDIVPILNDIRHIKFGVETYINLYYQSEGKRIQYILLEGLVHPSEYGKTSTIKATTKYVKEGGEIAAAMMNNYELILKRFNKNTAKNIDAVQVELNKKLTSLKNKINIKK